MNWGWGVQPPNSPAIPTLVDIWPTGPTRQFPLPPPAPWPLSPRCPQLQIPGAAHVSVSTISRPFQHFLSIEAHSTPSIASSAFSSSMSLILLGKRARRNESHHSADPVSCRLSMTSPSVWIIYDEKPCCKHTAATGNRLMINPLKFRPYLLLSPPPTVNCNMAWKCEIPLCTIFIASSHPSIHRLS